MRRTILVGSWIAGGNRTGKGDCGSEIADLRLDVGAQVVYSWGRWSGSGRSGE